MLGGSFPHGSVMYEVTYLHEFTRFYIRFRSTHKYLQAGKRLPSGSKLESVKSSLVGAVHGADWRED